MSEEKKEPEGKKIYATGLDIGTMFLQAARDDGKGNIVYNEVRNCYRELEYEPEFEETLKNQNVPYVKLDNKLYVLGNAAYQQARMAEFANQQSGSNTEILKRPMRDGILNPDSPKISMMIMRELLKNCIEAGIGEARPGEILFFSIPANPLDSKINNTFHTKTWEKFLQSLGFDARPLSEGLSIVYAENPKMHMADGTTLPFTGIGMSCGAGQVNVCLAERGMPIDEFSVARSGDFIDENAARMTGQPKTKVLRVKERDLDFNNIDENNEIILALDCYYEDMIRYVFGIFAKRFEGNKGSIDHPIDLIISGGTASPPGFDKKVKRVLDKMNLPFEIKSIRLAGEGKRESMLRGTAKGCFLRAKQAAKKAAQGKEFMKQIEEKS